MIGDISINKAVFWVPHKSKPKTSGRAKFFLSAFLFCFKICKSWYANSQ
jgi:hypothetical protein